MENAVELRSRSLAASSHKSDVGSDEQDGINLRRLGKKPVLKRKFSFVPLLGFSCTVLLTWEATFQTFQLSYANGGPAGSVYGYLIVWFGMFCTYLCISELASMAPTSGGQYHWVSMLAPRSCNKFLSYITGWLTVVAWQSACSTGIYTVGAYVQGLIAICNSSYSPKGWQTTLISWSVLALAVSINILGSTSLAKFEGLILVLHIVGFIAIILPLTYLAPHNSASEVFQTFINSGGWGSQGLSFLVGLIAPVYMFAGADCAVHLAEEIKDAATVVPRTILITLGSNGVLGFAMLIALLFCVGDPSTVQKTVLETSLEFPFIQVFLDATKSVAGTVIMTSILLVLIFAATVGFLASSSRMFWSFARDRGVPFWRTISKVNSRTFTPVVAIMITSAVAILLTLIAIGSSIAFNDILSIPVVGLYATYLLPVSLLMYRRTTNAIRLPAETPFPTSLVNTSESDMLMWGPFRMPSVIGIMVNGFAIVYLIVVFVFAFWPPATPVRPASMNYSCLVFGVTTLFSIVWYVAHARKVYQGPVNEGD